MYRIHNKLISNRKHKKDELMENSSRFVVHLVPFAPISYIVKLLALALTNLVLSLVNLVTNLAKPSLGQPSY